MLTFAVFDIHVSDYFRAGTKAIWKSVYTISLWP